MPIAAKSMNHSLFPARLSSLRLRDSISAPKGKKQGTQLLKNDAMKLKLEKDDALVFY